MNNLKKIFTASALAAFIFGSCPVLAEVPDLGTVACVKTVLSGFPDTVSVTWAP